ncbi:MAG: hypothetical protein AVDCRST_MAG25-1829, partial [uncultured Rubrobacteraceae bacterium]
GVGRKAGPEQEGGNKLGPGHTHLRGGPRKVSPREEGRGPEGPRPSSRGRL